MATRPAPTNAGDGNSIRNASYHVPTRIWATAKVKLGTTEDRFVKSKRSLDVGDGEKVCDGNAVGRRRRSGRRKPRKLVHAC
jgi:hypothetical protein